MVWSRDSLLLISKKLTQDSLFKSSFIYTMTSLLNRAIPFLLLPVLTRYLTPEDYGIVAMFTVVSLIVGTFTGLSVHGSIQREYYNKENINFKVYVGNTLIILFVSTLLTLLLSFLIEKIYIKYIPFDSFWMSLIIIMSFFQFLTLSNLAIYQAQMKAFQYGLVEISQTLINVLLSIIFVVLFHLNWQGRILGQLIAVLIVGLYSLYLLIKNWVKWSINIDYIKKALNFSIPLIPHTLGGMLIATADRFLLTNLLGLEQTGIYMVGLQIGMVIGLLADSFNRAYVPWLFKSLNQNDERVKYKIVKFTYLYFIGILLLACTVSLFFYISISFIVGEKFIESRKIILWIALGNAFNGMYYMVTNYIFYVYKTKYLMIITFLTGVINVGLTYVFIKIYGLVGAALAYMLSFFFIFILTWMVSAKVYKMPWTFFISKEPMLMR